MTAKCQLPLPQLASFTIADVIVMSAFMLAQSINFDLSAYLERAAMTANVLRPPGYRQASVR